ncbi:cofactor-independent phosphoglycerate mutase [Coriobacteriia bacterium Es71-Z0120]|uniref:cofactor-independent phosphoglycerate mutase n=1 Tax=Parvivirga hydrogeniphila TaxID=2939460 RepID=UPI002260B940|nr:cofactor-independent phosphoglycerate mutase [Parvivirga hydrogeniphila]MCL4078621.1 cofactor-independent phosphoglycerate mutase [Parvivirga hydrogeniphila]
MKHVVVILDGAAGWPLEELDGATALEAARTPNLDALAAEGIVGLAQTVPPGAEPSSSAACTSILGYDPVRDYVGRGAIEAASMGISLADDEVALRMNLVHVADGIMRSYSCGHIATDESRRIVEDLARELADETFAFCPGVAYRHILVVKGHPELLDARYTPPHDISDKPVEGHEPRGSGADLLLDLMERAREVLAASATNRARMARGELHATEIWPFWPGAAPQGLRPFTEARGIRAALTSGVDLLNGLAVLFGIDRLDIAGVTDGPDTDYAAQADGALAALADHDLVVIHVESPDEEGHAGDVAGKIAAIEAIDREIVGRIRACGKPLRVLCMPDHPTPIALKTHVGEPVPFVVHGPGIEARGARAFNERTAAETGLVVDPGRLVMDMLLEAGTVG